jgi:hypothetical protein
MGTIALPLGPISAFWNSFRRCKIAYAASMNQFRLRMDEFRSPLK